MKLDMSRAWNDATAMISANRETVLILAGVFFFLPNLVLMLSMPDMASTMQMQPADSEQALEQMTGMYAQMWWAFVLIALLQGVGMLASLSLLGNAARPTVGEAIKAGVVGLLPYIGVQILQTLLFVAVLGIPFGAAVASGLPGLAFVVGVAVLVAFLYLFTKFSLSAPVIAIDHLMNPLRAMGTSWRITKGNSLRLFLFYLLLFVALLVVFIIVSMVFGMIFALMGSQIMLIGNGITASLINAASITIFLAVLAAVHRQLAGPTTEDVRETFE